MFPFAAAGQAGVPALPWIAPFVLLLLAVLCAFAVTGVTTATRTANYDYRNSRTAYAAEGAADDIMQQLSGMVDDGFISQSELDSLSRPTVPGFTIANMSVRAVGGATQETANDGPFAGLYALVRNYDITTRAVRTEVCQLRANAPSVELLAVAREIARDDEPAIPQETEQILERIAEPVRLFERYECLRRLANPLQQRTPLGATPW